MLITTASIEPRSPNDADAEAVASLLTTALVRMLVAPRLATCADVRVYVGVRDEQGQQR